MLELGDGEGGGVGAEEVGAEGEEIAEGVEGGAEGRGADAVGKLGEGEVEIGGVLGEGARGVEEGRDDVVVGGVRRRVSVVHAAKVPRGEDQSMGGRGVTASWRAPGGHGRG